MPGIIVFRRRWSVGSDDLIVPGLSLSLLHCIWLIIVIASLSLDVKVWESDRNSSDGPMNSTFSGYSTCNHSLEILLIVHMVLLILCLILEISMMIIALKGTMWNTAPRQSMEYILYIRLLMLICELIWSSLSIAWLHAHYHSCPGGSAKEILLGLVICNFCVLMCVLITVWCSFDRAGRSWVKMKRFQRSMREGETKFHYKRSSGNRPNWRQRKVLRTYQDTWNHRCRMLFCCVSRSDEYKDSFSEIARLLTDFFRDLDLVPTDVVAGLVLLRKQQRKRQESLIRQ